MVAALLVFMALLASASATAFVDLNCTNQNATASQFVQQATACEDLYATTTCATLFGTAVVPMSDTDRDAKCTTDADTKKLATAACPKSCGFCCLTPEYNCANAQFPRVKCETVTQAQCKDSTWRPILASDCPNVCGFCKEGGCVDAVIECANDISVCRNVDMQEFVKVNCQKTCGYCSSTTAGAVATTAAGSSGTICSSATDSSTNCASWKTNGFCTNTFYTLAQRKSYCGKTCNLC
ncbi:unnamed protein product [Nippostrongylus brasiliensis]|uniref:ShKT domain-containing protein n=1 Tax=Nippostrongylus brasiliensis TaxID=27835 RepID=A0A0N4XTJ7_NIPBR|nr:hypothetical protein Q1695_014976 [Nippostrongylus brasiliensis]VDL69525.1 unnamed protein product [Nippostrongylus brasiliensis]